MSVLLFTGDAIGWRVQHIESQRAEDTCTYLYDDINHGLTDCPYISLPFSESHSCKLAYNNKKFLKAANTPHSSFQKVATSLKYTHDEINKDVTPSCITSPN